MEFFFCPWLGKHIIAQPGSSLGGNFLPARDNFPFTTTSLSRMGIAVGGPCLASHVSLSTCSIVEHGFDV